ncbi:MAG: LacI family DNA-binding transcriptional regulator [Dermatophilaceae bacterium]
MPGPRTGPIPNGADSVGSVAPATLTDVARAAGVSLATASRVLNGSTRKVRDEYAGRVEHAARALGYTPNLSAQAVARGTTQSLALVVADIADPYFSSIAAGVVEAAEGHGLLVTLAITGRDPVREIELVRLLRGQRPQAIVLVGSRQDRDRHRRDLVAELERFEQAGGQVTIVSQPDLPFHTIEIDNIGGARALAEALTGRGYRRAAVLTGPPELRTARDRDLGFSEHFAASGLAIPDHLKVPGDFTRDGGFVAAGELVRRGLAGVDLVFAVNDVMAVGAMAYLRSAGVALPEDVAVAGFDDIPGLRDITPALTTVALPMKSIGRRAVATAMGVADAGTSDLVQGTVVVRESTPNRATPSEPEPDGAERDR